MDHHRLLSPNNISSGLGSARCNLSQPIGRSQVECRPSTSALMATGSAASWPPPLSGSTIWTDERYPLTKPLIDLEDYFKILERTVTHPNITPRFRYRTYSLHSADFGSTNLRPYDSLSSAAALRSAPRPKMVVDRTVPSTSARIAKALEEEIEECTHITKGSLLNTCSEQTRCLLEYLKEIDTKLAKLISRAKTIKKGPTAETHKFGLGQLGGFCKELHSITFSSLPGTQIFTTAASSGFSAVLGLLRDVDACKKLLRCSFRVDGCPSEEDVAKARIKVQAAYDSVMEAYWRVGRPGFRGNWTELRRCDGDVLRAEEIESLLASFMAVYAGMGAVTADLVEVFRAFVYSDNVQKTYLVKHLRSFPKDDEQKVWHQIEVLNQRLGQIHNFVAKINTRLGHGVSQFCPPPLIRPVLPPLVTQSRLSFHEIRHQPSAETVTIAENDLIHINPEDNLSVMQIWKDALLQRDARGLGNSFMVQELKDYYPTVLPGSGFRETRART